MVVAPSAAMLQLVKIPERLGQPVVLVGLLVRLPVEQLIVGLVTTVVLALELDWDCLSELVSETLIVVELAVGYSDAIEEVELIQSVELVQLVELPANFELKVERVLLVGPEVGQAVELVRLGGLLVLLVDCCRSRVCFR